MDEKDSIIRYLEQDRIKNLSMIYFLRNNPVIFSRRIGDSVVLKGTSDQDWIFISCSQPEELERILDSFKDDDRYFASLESWMLPYFKSRWKIEWILNANRYYLPDDISIEPPTGVTIRNLKASEAEYIYGYSEYQAYTSVDYLKMRIEQGLSAGIEENGQLLAWVLTHDDSAIGTLHVLECARRQGYASELTQYMIYEIRRLAIIPFVQIESKNNASIRLAQKLGFQFDREVSWLAGSKIKRR